MNNLFDAPSALLAGREASATPYTEDDLIYLGKDYSTTLPANKQGASSNNVKFSPSWVDSATSTTADLGYCMYLFTIGSYDKAAEIHYASELPQSVADILWIGVADIPNDRWKWFPASTDGTLELPSFAPYMDAAEELLVALVVAGSDVVSIPYVFLGPPQVTAELFMTPYLDMPPVNATLNAGSSATLVGTIDKFEWDFESDGTFDQDTGTVNNTSHTYDDPGEVTATVRVTNSFGVAAEDSYTINVTGKWMHTWGREGNEYVADFAISSEPAIYIVGQGYDPGSSSTQLLLYKLDSTGDLVWVKNWYYDNGTKGNDGSLGRAVTFGSNGNVYVAGSAEELPQDTQHLVIQEWSVDGTLNWSKSWGGPDGTYNDPCQILCINDYLYVFATTDAYAGVDDDFAILKLDLSGNLQWFKTYGGTESDRAYDAVMTGLLMPTGFVVVGNTDSFSANDGDILFTRFNLDGEVQVQQRWNAPNNQIPGSVVGDAFGMFSICGRYLDGPAGMTDFLLLRVNSSGGEIAKVAWGTPLNDYGHGILQSSGGYLLCGVVYDHNISTNYGQLVYLDDLYDEGAAHKLGPNTDGDAEFFQLGHYAGGQLVMGRVDSTDFTFTAQTDGTVHKNLPFNWVTVAGAVTTRTETLVDNMGYVADRTNNGVIDTGGGNGDAFMMLEDYP